MSAMGRKQTLVLMSKCCISAKIWMPLNGGE
jgi:hypothetical protein